MNRPLVWFTGAFALGMFATAEGMPLGGAVSVSIIVAGVGLTFLHSPAILSRMVSVLLVAFGGGALLWSAHHHGAGGDPLSRFVAGHPEIENWAVEGTVRLSGLEPGDAQRLDFFVDADRVTVSGEQRPTRGGVSVRWNKREGSAVYAGDRVRIKGLLTIALGNVNFGVQGYEDYLRRQGINSAVTAWGSTGVEVVSGGAWWSPKHAASRFREVLTERLSKAIPDPAKPFVWAVWLGHRTMLDDDEYQRFIESGTAHILSVSGIHMSMIYLTLAFILRTVVKRRRFRALLILLCIVAFTLMSGMRLSALRSAVMLGMYVLAELFDREPDAPTALSLSALVLLGWNPDVMFDIGFQLSFLSVASILLYAKEFDRFFEQWSQRFRRMLRHYRPPSGGLDDVMPEKPQRRGWLWSGIGIRATVSVSLAAQLLPMPLAISSFHVLPLFGVIANLFVVPLSTCVLWLCLMTSVAAMVSPGIGMLFGHSIWPVVGLIHRIIEAVTWPSFSYLYVNSPTQVGMLGFYGAAVALLAWARGTHVRLWFGIACGMALFTVVFWNPLRAEATVTFLDVGHGDAIFVHSEDGKTLLVDGGDRHGHVDAGRQVVAPFLWASHARRLDYVAASHGDLDHVGGLDYIVKHFQVGTVLLSGTGWHRPHEEAFIRLCEERGVSVRRLYAGERLGLGAASIEVLHPRADEAEFSDVNNNSLVLRVAWRGTSVLLCGDVETKAEEIVSRYDCRAAVLKSPHHGSKTSSSSLFLEAVSPADCVVSTGGSRGREPVDDTVLDRYQRRGIRVWRTDVLGSVRLVDAHGSPEFEAARPQRGYPYAQYPENPL